MVRHHVGLRFGISIEHWAPWWMDWLKSTGLTLLLGVVVLGILYALMRWSERLVVVLGLAGDGSSDCALMTFLAPRW